MTCLILILSALLTSLTLHIDALWVLSYFSMAPLFFFLVKFTEEKRKYRRLYGMALLWSMVYFMGVYCFFWKMYPMEFLGLSKPVAFFVAVFCWLGLSFLQALPTALVAPLFRLFYRHRKLSPLLFAALWTIFEWLQNFTWAGVPFLRLALSQTSMLPAMQSASLFGSLFLSFLVALVNTCIGMGFYYFHINGKHCKAVRMFPILGVSLILLNLGFGLIRVACYSEEDAEKVPVALIQGNIGSADKWADGSAGNAMRTYFSLTRQAISASSAKLVLLPETALNFYLLSPDYEGYVDLLRSLAMETGTILFVGTFTSEADSDGIRDYNSIVAFFPDGTVEENPYNKRHLVPFGEYVPMESLISALLPFLADLNLFSSLSPGEDSAIVSTEFGNVGRLVCFDSIYESLTLQSVRDGAEILLLSTNDSWYLDSAAVRMHNDHAKLRAVESGRYILRAANTGISSIIDPLGHSQAELGALEGGTVTGTAVFRDSRTLYSYIGDLIVLFFFAVPAFEIGWKTMERRKRKEAEMREKKPV